LPACQAIGKIAAIVATTANVIVGTPICRRSSYAVDRFLCNQQEIQRHHPSSELVLSTSELDFAGVLRNRIASLQLRGTVIQHQVVKPDHARSRLWDIACGREAIRKHVLSQTQARHLLFLDADMTFEPAVIGILEREIRGCGAVFSGYPLRDYGTGLAGAGCVMLAREIMERLQFRCYEFKNGETIFEDNVLEMDLFRLGGRARKGFFVAITHYTSPTEARHVTPQPLGLARRAVNLGVIRYVLIRASILVRCNIPWRMKVFLNRFIST
jgi:hypothetical protein